MSVVVAIKDEDKVWMACDSQSTRGGSKRTLSNPSNYKIYRPSKEKETLIATVGLTKFSNALATQDEFIDELTKLKNEFGFKYMVTNIVPKLFSIGKQYMLVKKVEGQEIYNLENDFLFAYKDKLFTINSGCVFEIEDYDAIGSGFELALGYLHNAEEKDKKEMIIKAIKSAIKTDNYVNYPIIVMNTKDDEVIIIEK